MPTSPRRSTETLLPTTVGGGVPDAPHSAKQLYILHRQRQRRRSRDDTKLRPRPTENPACRPERKSRNHPVSGALLGTFPVREKYPAGGMDQPIQPPFPQLHAKKQTRRKPRRVFAFWNFIQDSSIRSLSSSSPESLRNRSSRSSTVSFARSSPSTSRTIFP